MPNVTHLLGRAGPEHGYPEDSPGAILLEHMAFKCDKIEKPRELSCWSGNNFAFTSGIVLHTWNSKHLQTDIIISVLQMEKNRNGEGKEKRGRKKREGKGKRKKSKKNKEK